MSFYAELRDAQKDAVEAALAGLASWAGLTVTVAVREKPHFDRDRDTLPFVILSSEKGEGARPLAMGNVALLSYRTDVTVLLAARAMLTDPVTMARIDDARDAIREALFRRTVGPLTLAGCSYDPAPAYDDGDLSRLFALSKQSFTARKSGRREAAS